MRVLAKSVQEGGQAHLIATEFSSSEDRDHFIERLENLGTIFLDRLPRRDHVADRQHAGCIEQGTTAVVYINEVAMMTKPPEEAGRRGPISFIDDVAALVSVKFDGIEVPDDSGWFPVFVGMGEACSSTSGR